MINKLMAVAAFTLVANSVFAMDCSVVKYESKDSDVQTTLDEFEVKEVLGQEPGEGEPRTLDGMKYLLSVSTEGLLYVEVKNASDETLFITTSDVDSPLGVEIPSIKHIVTCNPSDIKTNFFKLTTKKRLQTNPQIYGESMRKFTKDPGRNGTSSIVKSIDKPKLGDFEQCSEEELSEARELFGAGQYSEAYTKIMNCAGEKEKFKKD